MWRTGSGAVWRAKYPVLWYPRLASQSLACPPASLQCIGRGLRPHEGKDDCIVIDMTGGSERGD